ncbi:MAG: hypothetical protein WC915_00775 [archaeon]|jgi:hypothetical protein
MKNPLNALIGNTKSQIIECLEEKPLTLKELNSKLNSLGKNISYQAIHKTVNEMINDEILEKIGSEININKKWAEQLYLLGSNLKQKENLKDEYSDAKIYHFETFIEAGKFLIKVLNSIQNTKEKGVCFTKHAWPFFGLSDNDYKELNRLLTETKFYEIIHYDTHLDKIFGKAMQDAGKIIKIGSDLDFSYDFLMKSNIMTQIHFSQDFAQKFHEMFMQHKNLDEFPISKIIEQFMIKKTNITVIIIKDKEICDKARTAILSKF